VRGSKRSLHGLTVPLARKRRHGRQEGQQSQHECRHLYACLVWLAGAHSQSRQSLTTEPWCHLHVNENCPQV